jgi:ATP-binding cassette, subfamily B, multidrug efflux pump
MTAQAHTNTPSSADTPSNPQADWRWLWRYLQRERRAILLSTIGSGVFGLLSVAEPFLIGVVVDHLKQGAAMEVIVRDVALIVAVGALALVAFYFQRQFSGDVSYYSTFGIRRDLFDDLLAFDQGFYNQNRVGDLLARMHSDMEMVWRLIVLVFLRLGQGLTMLALIFVLLLSVNVLLTVVMFAVLLISTYFQIRAGEKLTALFERVQDQNGALAAFVQDTVSGIQTVKTFGRESGAAERFAQENAEYRRRWLYFKRRNEPVGMLPNAISQATLGVVVLYGGTLTVQGTITLGNFTQFLLYMGVVSAVLLHIGTVYQRYQQTRGVLQRVTPLLQAPAIVDGAPAAAPTAAPATRLGDIRLENVGVCLEGNWVLRGVNLHIPAGQTAALVGATGAGKTVLVNLLGRLFDPNEGRVLIDGIDVRDYVLADLRAKLAYVPQSTFLFSQTLEENIRMGQAEISPAAIERALHISRVSNDLGQLPDGLNTLVGEKGVMLSGGQKQRVAIARALVRDPHILILDDALSSVDTHTAADILASLNEVLRQRTSIIIAQRTASVKDADQIYVLADGCIAEHGRHDPLVKQQGLYAAMVARELVENEELP